MKFKQRALSLMLTLMMVLTFMPALAFADDDQAGEAAPAANASAEESSGWFEAYADEDDVELIDDEYYTLQVWVDYEDYETEPEFTYEWFDEDDNRLSSDTDECTVYDSGDFYCVVSDDQGNDPQTVYFHVEHPYIGEYNDYWWIYSYEDEVNLDSNGEATLTVKVEVDDGCEEPALTFTWYDPDGKKLSGNGRSIKVNKTGRYSCEATDGNRDDSTSFNVCSAKYWWNNGYRDYNIFPGETRDLKVELEVYEGDYKQAGLELPTFTYKWVKAEWDDETDDEKFIQVGGNSDTLEGVGDGYYICRITDSYGNNAEAAFNVREYDSDGGWIAYPENNEKEVNLDVNDQATLSVAAKSLSGALPKLTYTWYDEDEHTIGGNSPQLTVNEDGFYSCLVTDGVNEKYVEFYVNEYDYYNDDIGWYVDNGNFSYYLENGKVTLTAVPEYWGEGTPKYTYQWYKVIRDADGDWVDSKEISGATGPSYVAKEKGEYFCDVMIDVNGLKAKRTADFVVYDWWITNNRVEYLIEYNGTETLKAETNYKGSDITYQWYRYDGYDEESDESIVTKLEGATKASYTIKNFTEEKEYRCEITAGGQTQKAYYWTYFDTSDYEWIYTYEDAAAEYKTHDGRKLTVDYRYDPEYLEDRYDANFPEEGDTITMTSSAGEDVYTFNGSDFVNGDNEVIYLYTNLDGADASSGEIWANIYSERKADHAKKTITFKYSTWLYIDASITTDVASIAFEPSKISLYSEDVKWTDSSNTWYSFYRRHAYKDAGGYIEYGAFVAGDKLTVKYKDGTTRVYIYTDNYGFVNKTNGEWIYAYPDIDNGTLVEGNNTIKVCYQGRFATVSVFLDTPALREWNGVLDKKLPAAKGVKVKAGKKSATVKWTKASAKNLKKFDTVEIQISTDKKFAKAKTIRKSVKKSKKNITIKKLKSKKTYYVRVRNVKGKGEKKKVSKWSKVYKVKIK